MENISTVVLIMLVAGMARIKKLEIKLFDLCPVG